ncbi:MAG TPA: TIGR03086 family metal-binding protein [Acidimicrobiales bacterium]|nr:TIGR03086 family metal-binding protein [Acidimicrobiales bacterium]
MSADVLQKAFASTAAVLANVKADQLDDPTPCASWKVRDLLNHVVGGTHFFATIAETGGPPAGAGDAADFSAGDFNAAFAEGAKRAVAAFRAPGAMEKQMTLPFGQLPGAVFVTIAATDSFTHGWDLARSTGQPSDLDPDLAGQLLENARGFIPDAMRGTDGQAPFGPRVDVPGSAPAADQLAGFLGRQV